MVIFLIINLIIFFCCVLKLKNYIHVYFEIIGWGSWSSEVPKVKKFKQKKKPSKIKPNLVMKDGRVGIIQHQLGQVPHPFKSFDDCQSEMSQPVGDTFVPKTAVVKAIKPKVHVKLGAMLAPDSKDEMY